MMVSATREGNVHEGHHLMDTDIQSSMSSKGGREATY